MPKLPPVRALDKVLAIDIGGTNVKILVSGAPERRKAPSGPKMTPQKMVAIVKELAHGWEYDVVSIGYPGLVLHGKVAAEPHNLAKGWKKFDFQRAFGRPVRIMNDAAMQALGSYRGGRMLFLGLGTGLGSALIVDGVLEPMELAHLPYKHDKTFEDYVGTAALLRLGEKKWTKNVFEVAAQLRNAVQAEYVVLGGGNAKRLSLLPRDTFLGDNQNARIGGLRLWEQNKKTRRKTATATIRRKLH